MKKLLLFPLLAGLAFTSCKKTKVPSVDQTTSTARPGDWSYDASAYEYSTVLIVSKITQDIVDNGTVMTFLKKSDGTYVALPTTFYSTGYSFTMGFSYEVSKVHIYMDCSSDLPGLTFNSNDYKVVTISRAQREAHPNTNWKNYDEVQKVLLSDAVAE